MRPKTNARIAADGKERLEAAIAALPADERRGAARRAGLGAGPARDADGRVWLGRKLPSVIVRWLDRPWVHSVDRRLFLRPTGSGDRPRTGDR
ncbi:MAG: hypothetical protein M3Q10_01645 [Chloroflexota bacterium]|nr:hypothetical protein [Chloroflexota bacterium]